MRKTKSYEETLHQVPRYPLSWPEQWARTKPTDRKEARFGKRVGKRVSVAEGMESLIRELGKIKAKSIVISTNVPVRKNGALSTVEPSVEDVGAATYFCLQTAYICFACDKWDRVGDNLYAIACHIKSIRDQNRWGVSTIDRAFKGYAALPPPPTWWETLGVDKLCNRNDAQKAFRDLARQMHPDKEGGDHTGMVDLNVAWDIAQKHFDSLDGK